MRPPPQTALPSRPPSLLLARPASTAAGRSRGVVPAMQRRPPTRGASLASRAEGGGASSSSGAGSAGGDDGAAKSSAILARIAAAKKYAAGAADSAPTAAPQPPADASPSSVPSWMLAAGGGDFAASRPSSSSSSSSAPTALPLPFAPGGGGENDGDDDPPPPAPRRPDFFTAEGDAAPQLPDLLAAAPERLDGGSADRPANWLAGVFGGGAGGGSAAAADVQFDGSNMRAEAFSAAREAMARRRGAEIITADPSYDPGFVPPAPEDAALATGEGAAALKELERQAREQGGGGRAGGGEGAGEAEGGQAGGAYRPKVSTWGVFERPNDISAAYGGGRTLKPGQELETREQREAREKAYADSLAAYRKKAGLEDVAPETEAEARRLLERADVLFRQGKLREALAPYEEARGMIPLRTSLGGRATLGAAICSDSLGRAEAARDLYRRLRGHPDAAVAKQAKRLTFGFDAAKFLKAETISYARGNKEYAKYFRAFADANRVYAASEEERQRDEAAARRAAILAIGVVAAPVAGVLALVAGGGR
jgi:tetratricopeptide (TPR) repeat protein